MHGVEDNLGLGEIVLQGPGARFERVPGAKNPREVLDALKPDELLQGMRVGRENAMQQGGLRLGAHGAAAFEQWYMSACTNLRGLDALWREADGCQQGRVAGALKAGFSDEAKLGAALGSVFGPLGITLGGALGGMFAGTKVDKALETVVRSYALAVDEWWDSTRHAYRVGVVPMIQRDHHDRVLAEELLEREHRRQKEHDQILERALQRQREGGNTQIAEAPLSAIGVPPKEVERRPAQLSVGTQPVPVEQGLGHRRLRQGLGLLGIVGAAAVGLTFAFTPPETPNGLQEMALPSPAETRGNEPEVQAAVPPVRTPEAEAAPAREAETEEVVRPAPSTPPEPELSTRVGRVAVSCTNARTCNLTALRTHYRLGELIEATAYFEHAAALDPSYDAPLYNAACTRALLGDAPAALSHLRRLQELGTSSARSRLEQAQTDADLRSLWANPDFIAIVR